MCRGRSSSSASTLRWSGPGRACALVLLRRGGPITGIHPAAECFPMMSEVELRELAVDTAANGLREPITLDPPGAVLDERNRLKACDIARVAL
jgi:hypothetical protein